ncbi:MAG: response regulator [Chthoniobacterales bacterium]
MAAVRVLVVEDHPATAQGLKKYLELTGHQVEVASDVKSGLHLAATFDFEVLVCDLMLPDGTGWELMEKLGKQRPVRGIAFSAYGGPEDLQRSEAAGFAEHIVKGSSPETLVAAISRLAAAQARAD